MTGTKPAHDTRFSSSNLTSARRHGCDNLTGSASLTDRCWILRKPIIAGQEALSCQPRRRREWSFGGLRLSAADSPSVMLRSLLEIATGSGDGPDVRGARRLIGNICGEIIADAQQGSRIARPRFEGFARLRRCLLASKDDDARRAGAALFGIRSPTSAADWRLFEQLVIECQDYEYEDVQEAIVGATLATPAPPMWIERLEAILKSDIRLDLVGVIIDQLGYLLGQGVQSLSSKENVLGLPLQ